MACIARLLPALGLYVTRHLAALLPLLLEWSHAYDDDSAALALLLLQAVVQHAWPRMSVHAAVLRRTAGAVLTQAAVRGCIGQQQGSGADSGAADCLAEQRGLGQDSSGGSRRVAAAQGLLAVLDGL
jgi:hypothetical protein